MSDWNLVWLEPKRSLCTPRSSTADSPLTLVGLKVPAQIRNLNENLLRAFLSFFKFYNTEKKDTNFGLVLPNNTEFVLEN